MPHVIRCRPVATSRFNWQSAFYDSAMIDMVLIFAMGISGIHFV